jgi:ABC-type bacteriocin/lantibiotic exporter with double-glycine peptidase domain
MREGNDVKYIKHFQKRRHRNFLLVPGIFLVISGCASLSVIDPSSFRYSPSAITLNVSFEKQGTESLCGVAAADMITRYYGIPLGAKQRQLLVEEAMETGGVSGRTLKSAFQETGYFAVVLRGSLDHGETGLYRHLGQGRPVVVMFKRSKDAIGHYVVVTGFDPAQDALVIVDPNKGQRIEYRKRFLSKWEFSERFTLLAVPHSLKTADVHNLAIHNPN